MISFARTINPDLKCILTVSPVPLVATASGRHVLVATTYSKAVLRVAADSVSRMLPDVAYFPAYELVTGPQAAGSAFEADLRNVTERAVAEVMGAFFATFLADETGSAPVPADVGRGRPTGVGLTAAKEDALQEAMASVIRARCEEEMMDSG